MIDTRLLAAIRKETLAFWRNPASRAMVTIMPLMQTLLFSFAATMDVRSIDVAILDSDNGRWSHELISRVDAARFTNELVTARSLADLADLVSYSKVVVALHILPEFSREIAAGRTGVVQVIVDGRKANEGQISVAYLTQIAEQLGAELSEHDVVERRPDVRVRHWFNPNLEFRWFIVPTIGAMVALMIPMMISVQSIASERELGSYDQLLVSPLTSAEIIFTKLVPAVGAGMLVSLMVLLLAVFGFQIPFQGSVLLLGFGIFVFILAVVGIGLAVSAFCYTQQQALLSMFIMVMPLMLTSGYITPVDNMPDWLQVAAQANPLKHINVIVQGSYFKSMTALEVWANVWPMLIIAAVTLSTATVVVRSRLQ